MDWSRRRYLGAAAAALTAGCAAPAGSRDDAGASTPTSTTAPRPEPSQGSVYTRVYREAVASVVDLRTVAPGGVGGGSGFAYDADHLVTNQHVIAGADRIDVRFARGEWAQASVVGADVYSDLAVLRAPDRPEYVRALPRLSGEPTIGQEVVAIGSPFGLEKSLSAGVVSGVNRAIRTEGGFSIPDAVQTDAAVNPGNSGGPLVTLDARAVGVIRSGGGENIGFAISTPLVERVASALIERGEYRHPYMGVTLAPVTPVVAEANGLGRPRGVLVVEVIEGGPSAGVLRGSGGETEVGGIAVPTGGDVIVALGGRRIETLGDLSSYLALRTTPGETVPVTVRRGGGRREVDLTLGARPPPSRAPA